MIKVGIMIIYSVMYVNLLWLSLNHEIEWSDTLKTKIIRLCLFLYILLLTCVMMAAVSVIAIDLIATGGIK